MFKKVELFTVNKDSIEYVFREIAEQRQFFPSTTKDVLIELVKLDMKDIPYDGTLTDRNKLIEDTVTTLAEEYLKRGKLTMIDDKGEEIEPEYPEIESVTLSVKKELVEGEDTKAGAKIGSVLVKGGTDPYECIVTKGEGDFIIINRVVKTKRKLAEGSYDLEVKVIDKGRKEKTATETIVVSKAEA